jgi:hypothetical protein
MKWHELRSNAVFRRRLKALVAAYEEKQERIALYGRSLGVASASLLNFTAAFPRVLIRLLGISDTQAVTIAANSIPKF